MPDQLARLGMALPEAAALPGAGHLPRAPGLGLRGGVQPGRDARRFGERDLASYWGVKVWDTATGKTIRTLIGLTPAPSRAWRSAATATPSLRPVGTGPLCLGCLDLENRHKLEGHTDYVSCVAISPDSRLVASGSGDHTVKLWDAATGQEMRFRGHAGGLFSVAFSPDGRSLASASQDRTVRIWDVATGKEVHTLRGHPGAVLSVAYSRDGRRLASAGFDGSVKIWDAARASMSGPFAATFSSP